MSIPRKVFGELAEIIIEGGAKKATKYISKKEVVKATFQGKRSKRDRQGTILFTFGAPNYAERDFIKKCVAAGEKFPVRNIQIKWI